MEREQKLVLVGLFEESRVLDGNVIADWCKSCAEVQRKTHELYHGRPLVLLASRMSLFFTIFRVLLISHIELYTSGGINKKTSSRAGCSQRI